MYGTMSVQLDGTQPPSQRSGRLWAKDIAFFVLVVSVFGAQGWEQGFPKMARQVAQGLMQHSRLQPVLREGSDSDLPRAGSLGGLGYFTTMVREASVRARLGQYPFVWGQPLAVHSALPPGTT